ncbi:MAG: SulP family inorganic anion transporter [Pseudomonadota bacterium]
MRVNWRPFVPAAGWRGSVNRQTIRADLVAGFTNATIVLPQGVAFAAIAGLPPEYGLYTAMVTPVIAALFGSSMVMISGPTTAISALVFGALAGIFEPGSQIYIEHVLLLTVMVGLIQVALGLAGLGRLVAFVSHSVMLGFTAAAAVLIAASQLGDALGVDVERGGSVIERLWRAMAEAPEANWRALVIAGTALAAAVVIRQISTRLPNFILALGLAGLVSWLLDAELHGVETVGALPSVLPSFSPPPIDLDTIAITAEAAFAVALIGLLEAISIGRAFAYKTGRTFDANQEILGQGLSNTVGGFFQAYPGSGSFTRSGVNYESGAKTPLSAILSSAFLVGLLFLLAPLVAHIPIPALAGIILYVAFKLVHFPEIAQIMRTDGNETAIFVATFATGILGGLDFSIYVGVILSLLIFLNKTARPTLAISTPDANGIFHNAQVYGLPECPQVVFARLDGPLYFGSVEAIQRAFRQIERRRPGQKHMMLVLKGVGDIDLAGASAIVEESRRRQRRGGALYIVARYPPLVERLRKLNVISEIGEERLFAHKGQAVEEVTQRLLDAPCAVCSFRIFRECAGRPGGTMRESRTAAASPGREAEDPAAPVPANTTESAPDSPRPASARS